MFDGLIDGYTQSILIFTGISVIAAYSFFAPFKTGQVSLGQAGFMAVGAYASAVLTQKFGFPFAVSLPLAGLFAGVLDGLKNSSISPFMGIGAAVKGLIVMLLGGLGNVPGAMVAGLMLGMIEILSAAYIGTTERDLFSFMILILILLFRPTGLFGTRTAEQR